MAKGPFSRPPLATVGEKNADTLFLAVGQMLTTWETTEAMFARLFGSLISPVTRSYSARRAYGSLQSARGRKDLLENAAENFFRHFPNAGTEQEIDDILILYMDAIGRRNDIVHGVVLGGPTLAHGGGKGYFLGPSSWTSTRRKIDFDPSYLYTTIEIYNFKHHFQQLANRVHQLPARIVEIFLAASPETRARY
jgi:hypothetical protein